MLHVQPQASGPWTYDNYGTNPSGTYGTSVTPGASGAEGSWTQVASAANVAQDVYGMLVRVYLGSTSGAIKNHLMDIGVDPAGGTSYTAVISDIVCGESGTVAVTLGHRYFFPLFIKAGSSIAVRIQGSAATAGTVRVPVRLYGYRSRPEFMPVGSFSETIGTIASTQGVAFTPGNAADGSWVSLGTTAKPLWWWQLAYQMNNGVITAEYTYIDLAWGDASNKHIITRQVHGGLTTESLGDLQGANLCMFEAYQPVPAGATLYVRGRADSAPDTGYNAVAIGIGG
jgi:hypothetical protein